MKPIKMRHNGMISRFGLWQIQIAGYVTSMGRAEFALLFDAGYNKKPAFTNVLQAFKANK